jgi:DNA-binding transcriptional MocR family regulator
MKNTKPALLLYEKIANSLERQIRQEVLRSGDRLPSVRMVCRQYQVSMSTALQAYYQLEAKSLIEAKPQSGYYVCYTLKKWPSVPEISRPPLITKAQPVDEVVQKVYAGLANKNLTLFSMGVPSADLLPIAKLNKGLIKAMRSLTDSGTEYSPAQGNEKLRRYIAHSSLQWEGKLNHHDLITTSGCSNALALSLMTVTAPGDTIIVESPAFFGILQIARNLQLKVLELPTDPRTGIELDALKNVLEKRKIAGCILMSNFNNPLGSSMPDEHKKTAVELFTKHGVPLIEDDIYGEIYFSGKRPKTCKSYDQEGWVLWCSSVSKTLAPGYRVGWVAPGRFFDSVYKNKLFQNLSSATLIEETVANFFENGRYENHLRAFRKALYSNCLQYIRAITEYFPGDTKVTRPEGGFFLWLELNARVDTVDLFDTALKQKISIAPGRIFTLQNQFDHFLRLSYGFPWSSKIEQALKTLGKLVKTY